MSTVNTPTVGIGRLLSENYRYRVPDHQRDYSWSEDQIEQLFEDIKGAQSVDQKEYFLGLMVFIPAEKRNGFEVLDILDGQQRLVTTTIIIASIRHWLLEHGRESDSTKVQEDFVGIREYGESETEPRMLLNVNNNQMFYDYVVCEKPLDEIELAISKANRYSPNYNLLKAIIFCRKKIVEIAKGGVDESERAAELLFSLIKYIRDNVKVVQLVVSSVSDAYTVFETLNARGLDLSALDLVKNYVFGQAKKKTIDLEYLQKNWMEMMSNLSNTDSEDFLKIYWTSRNGRTQVQKIFPSLRENFKSLDSVKSLSKDLCGVSEQYEGLYVPDSKIWAGYSKAAKEHIPVLKDLGSKQISPILVSALGVFDSQEMEKLLYFMETLLVRFQLIIGGRTGLLEIACAKLAKKIFDRKILKTSQAFKEVEDIFPSDATFKDAFSVKIEKNSKKAVLLLKKLEIQSMKEQKLSNELSPGISLTLEHVLPKNPNQQWLPFFIDKEKSIEDYKYRIGNLCLLADVNRNLGSKGFETKKDTYKKSPLTLTREIGSQASWNWKTIEERQSRLAEMAAKAWRYPV